MSVIAVVVPAKSSLKVVVNTLAPVIKGHFEALNFHPNHKAAKVRKGAKCQVCYLRLSETLDALQVVERVNNIVKEKPKSWGVSKAFIPDHVPDLPLAKKPLGIPPKLRQNLRIEPDSIVLLLIKTHHELMCELQYKYTGLYNLSKKLGHKLLTTLASAIYDRLTEVKQHNIDTKTCLSLTKAYRKAYPHFADFQFILKYLHNIEDSLGKTRSQIVESELIKTSPAPVFIDNIPYTQIATSCNKYADRIGPILSEHVKSLHCETKPDDSEEEIARKKVRAELVKMSPYMTTIIKQVLLKNLVPLQPDTCQMKIYGEPYLSKKETMMVFLKKYGVSKVVRSNNMYNLLLFTMKRNKLSELMTMDGCVVGGSTLIIRSSNIPKFSARSTIQAKIKENFGCEQNEENYNEILDSLDSRGTDWED